MKNEFVNCLLLRLGIVFSLGIFVAGCGEEEIQLKPGPKLTRVINNFESVEEGLVKEQQLTAEEEARQKAIEAEYTKMMSPPEVSQEQIKRLELVPSQNIIESGERVGSIRFEGDTFSIENLKEISLEVESKKSGKTYFLDSVTSLWRADERTLIFELPEHQKPSYAEPIPIASIVIRTDSFILNEGETIKTDGRSLKIVADRVEINGSIVTSPLSTYADSENGRDAGNLDIVSSYSSFGPNHLIDVRGGSAGKLACADTVLKERGPQSLDQTRQELFDKFFSVDITIFPEVVSSVQDIDGPPRFEGAEPSLVWDELKNYIRGEGNGASLDKEGVISQLLKEYAFLWETKKTLGGTDENDFENRIYKKEFFPSVNLDEIFSQKTSAQDRINHINANWEGEDNFFDGWKRMIKSKYADLDERRKNQKEDSNTDGFWIADNRVKISSTLRRLRPVRKNSASEVILYEEPLVIEGFRPGGNSGQVRIYSGLSFILPPSNILFDAGQDALREKLNWQDYQDRVFGDREIPLYEDFQYMLSMQTWKNWSDKTYGPLLTMDEWGSFGKWQYGSAKFEVREDPTLPESVMTCEIADDVVRGEARLPLRMDNQVVILPERVMEIGLTLEDVPEKFKKASELQGESDPARRALNALKASKSGE